MSKSGGTQKLVFFITGCLIGFFVGYATTYQSDSKPGPVEVADTAPANTITVNADPVRELEPSPFKGTETPKVVIHEVSEFQ